jgi:MFS family permease
LQSNLEDGIGFPIFVRNRDGVRITAAGQVIVAYAQEALAARREIIAMAGAVHKGEVAPLRLGFSPFVNAELLEFLRGAYADIGGEFAGVVAGVMNIGAQLGGAATASLTPVIASHYGWDMSFFAAALLIVLGALAWLVVEPERRLSSSG